MNITSQDILNIYNKAKLMGVNSYLINLTDHGWYSKGSGEGLGEGDEGACDPFLLILHQDNNLAFYIPNDVERDFESHTLCTILMYAETQEIMHNRFDTISVLGRCPMNAHYLFSHFSADKMDLTELDMSKVDTMTGAFVKLNVNSLLLPDMEEVRLKFVKRMFAESRIYTINIHKFNTAFVTDFGEMFANSTLSVDMSKIKLNTMRATSYTNMYNRTVVNGTLDLSKFRVIKDNKNGLLRGILYTATTSIIIPTSLLKCSNYNKSEFMDIIEDSKFGLSLIAHDTYIAQVREFCKHNYLNNRNKPIWDVYQEDREKYLNTLPTIKSIFKQLTED